MESENRICQNCKNDFIIEAEDFAFYDKIHVPAPTFCPDCRFQIKFAHREERSLYKNTCNLCNRDMISVYPKDSPYNVFCSECWWSDAWDPMDYGRDYDFNRPFFEQFNELQKTVPAQGINLRNCNNCTYSHGLIRCKNCSFVFTGIQSVNCFYCQSPIFTKDSMDSDGVMNGDSIYENVNTIHVYNTKFVYFSNDCIDCAFLFNCVGCSDCFGCVNLRNQKYCIFNVKYTKEEYKEKIKYWDLSSHLKIKEAEEKFLELYYKTPRRFASIINSVNVLGDDIENTKNSKYCFDTRHGVEECKFVYFCGLLLKDSYDVVIGGNTSELLYETLASTSCQNSFFIRSCNNAINVEYSDNIYNGNNLFGCTKMRHKKYCILNKQYGKVEYEEILPKIKQHMIDMPYIDKKGRVFKYGDFFPIELSNWPYNESLANQWFPLSKEDILNNQYNYKEPIDRDYKISLKSEDLPDNIKDIDESILNEVILCEHYKNDYSCNEQCTMAFKIMPDELLFYKKMNIAIPRLCPNCRFYKRLKWRNPQKLWDRKCMNQGCENVFKTAISEDRKEIIYCETCYQQKFI